MSFDPTNQAADADHPEDDQDWDGISLEELGQAYAEAFAAQSDEPDLSEPSEASLHLAADDPTTEVESDQPAEPEQDDAWHDQTDAVPTPLAIIEAALFIGHPEGKAMTESELATLMRGVTADDVSQYVDRLNEGYQQHGQALRIHRDEDGLRMGVAPDMEVVRRAFYGKIRETRLSQPAIEVLSLVAYQPGITAEKVQDQRGKESGSLLSQLVRRRLLEQRRHVPEGATRPVVTYYPTERFLQLFSLDSLDDLPQVES